MAVLQILRHYYPGYENRSRVRLYMALVVLNPLSILQMALMSLQIP